MTPVVSPIMVRHPSRYSYGTTAAVVTSVGLIVGFAAASVSKAVVVSGLLIIALADNVSDSLSIHVYQESENLEARAAFRATLTNFIARLVVALSFVGVVLALPIRVAQMAAIGWGIVLLAGLTYVLSRHRNVRASREILKHLIVAIVVIVVSRALGSWIAAHVS